MKNSFVYIWHNKTLNRKYIGYHKGIITDGYISSSSNPQFWDDFNNPTMMWERTILFSGTRDECLSFEQDCLKTIDLRSNEYYNNARGSSIIFTEEVRKKMSSSATERWKNTSIEEKNKYAERMHNSQLGRIKSDEERAKISKYSKGKTLEERLGKERAIEIGKKIHDGKIGKHYQSDDFKNKLSIRMKNNRLGSLISDSSREKKRILFLGDSNPGKYPTKETRDKISKAKLGKPSALKGIPRKKIQCPHCEKIGADFVMTRWHFDNCKLKEII